MGPGILDVLKNDIIFLDGEPLVPEAAAKGTLVVGAPQGDLKQDAVRLAGGPYDHSVIMHETRFLLKFQRFSFNRYCPKFQPDETDPANPF
jgi:hypothetical protein